MAKKKKSAAKQRKALLLRLSPELHAELRRWADQDLRSLNGQIEYLLRDALKRRGRSARETGDDD